MLHTYEAGSFSHFSFLLQFFGLLKIQMSDNLICKFDDDIYPFYCSNHMNEDALLRHS
jgi:hypothetical protein